MGTGDAVGTGDTVSVADELPGLVQLARLPRAARAELLAGPSHDDPLLHDPLLNDPLQAVTALRRERPDLSPELASAVVAQRGYQAKARATGALPAGGPWLTTDVGLEQASRPEVAARRAATLAAAGVRSVVDASAGIGMDAGAFLEAGLDVVAFERHPVTFEVCRANLEHAAELFGTHARVENADSTQVGVIAATVGSLPSPVAVFIDPARRSSHRPIDGSRSRSERDRQLWSPPWSFVDELRREFEWVAVKTPPSFTPDAQWKAEWVAVGTSVVECALYSPRAAKGQAHRATILSDDVEWSLGFDIGAQRPAPSGLRGFLAEVHPVARRTGAIAEICSDAPGLAPVTDSTMWLTADSPEPPSPALRWFEVLGSGSLDQLTALCHDTGIDRVALKTLESKQPQRDMRARIGLPDGDEFAMIAIDGLGDHVLVRRMRPM